MDYVMRSTHHSEERRTNFMAEKKLQVKKLQVSFRTQAGILKAVRGISFDLYKGETLAIVGESGSGKSVTSKAIIGILSGNSIVEGGEILYDGQDLLKIDEEHFHKIRGDKIAMIFQDPLSSLNPIMRVGKQLTEAMILNGRARQRNSRKEFNTHLALLKKNLIENNPENKDKYVKMCSDFDKFCIKSTQLEKAYNAANSTAVSIHTNIDELVFLLEKNQRVVLKAQVATILRILPRTYHHYVVHGDELETLIPELNGLVKGKKAIDIDKVAVIDVLKRINDVVKAGIDREHPDFFRLGYYKFRNPDFDEKGYTGSIADLDKLTLDFLDSDFMIEFIKLGSEGILYSRNKSLDAKKELLPKLNEFRDLVNSMEVLDKKALSPRLRELKTGVERSIDYVRVKKHSVEYSFGISVSHEFKRYYEGLRLNPKNLRKYEQSKAKFDKLVESGKTPTWKVIPPYLVDLELTKSNIIKILDDLIYRYNKDIASTTYDPHKEMIELVDFFKEQASRLVYRVTQGIAKTRAIELLKEVGIAEPEIRYKQYPFEFSGGMRQRIVIAIALSANPDILICDEPTTALDVTIQSQILELINRIKKERNLSVIFITHDLGVVANMADRVAVMYAGKIVEYGTADDIFYDPKHPYTWALLASMPDLDTKEKLEAIPGTPPNMIYPPVGDAFAERNKYALEIDFEQEPPLFEVSETHYAATWLLHPNAPKVEPPKIITERIARMKKEVEDYGKDR